MLSNHITPPQLRLLAGLLAMPEKESLTVIEELAIQNNWLYESVQELKGTALEQWQAEHTRLFINGRPTCCPPFESVYRHGIMNGLVCSEIEYLYQSIGLESIEGVSPDYLGMMLECAAFLLEMPPPSEVEDTNNEHLVNTKEATAKEHFQTLWQNHLAKWVPKFANDLQQHSQLRLYQQLGLKLQELF